MQGGNLVLVVIAEVGFGFSNGGWSKEMFAARWGNEPTVPKNNLVSWLLHPNLFWDISRCYRIVE